MLANWITLSWFPLLLINVLVLYRGPAPLRLAAVALLFTGLMLDTVDGVVARKTGKTSLFGGVLDIAADRTYELVLWLCFADLGLIPVVIPLIVIAAFQVTAWIAAVFCVVRGVPVIIHPVRHYRRLERSVAVRLSSRPGGFRSAGPSGTGIF